MRGCNAMSRQCDICGKTKMAGCKITRDSQGILGHNKSPRMPNLQSVTVTDENGQKVKKTVCTRCLKKMKQESN